MKYKNRFKVKNWRKYLFEFLSIFLAVCLAFFLDRWNDKRRDSLAEDKILKEIYNGLGRDSLDIANDEQYFKIAFSGLNYFNDIVEGKIVATDSLAIYYFYFARESIVVQNKSGYEALKSRGLETIKNDSLRSKIIDLYEVDYELSRKFNEEHSEYKFVDNYFHKINDVLAPNFEYDNANNITGIHLPLALDEEKSSLLKSYLWKIAMGKQDRYQAGVYGKQKIGNLRTSIQEYLENN
ncbi:MAG: hypothetical protein WBG71_03175 [Leeuwenhoekiella sp.]